jgi:choline dehydrogenase
MFSFGTQILINAEKRAYGVAYYRHEIPQIAHARKEIIISCGSVGTPILLMRSGIGPANVLKEAKVTCSS